MSRSTLRLAVLVLGLITAAVHLYLGLGFGKIDPLFLPNGLGYLILVGAVVFDFPKGQRALAHYALMAFAAITILAYVAFNRENLFFPLGVFTKLDEILLIVATYLHLRAAN